MKGRFEEGGMRGWDCLIRNDLAIRMAGAVLVAIGVLAGHHLYAGAYTSGGRSISASELLWGALAYLACTSGCILTCLGAHIHDRIQVSGRWSGQANVRRRVFVETAPDMLSRPASRRGSKLTI